MSLLTRLFGEKKLAASTRRPPEARTSTAGNRLLDATRTVTMRQRMEMRSYGPIRTALEQYTQPILGAGVTVVVEDDDAITADLQATVEGVGRVLIEKALLALEYGWSPIEIVWTPGTWEPALRCPDPSTLKPVFEDGVLVGFEQTTTGARLVNADGWTDHVIALWGSEHGEVPGRALIDRAWYHYQAHRILTRWMAVNAKNVALPPVVVRHPELIENDADANASKALTVGKQVDQSDKRTVLELPEPTSAEEARWAIEYVETANGVSSLLELEARWLSRMYLSLGVPSEMLVNESNRGTQARAETVVDTFISRLDYIAEHVVEPPLRAMLQAVCDLRYGPGRVVKVDVETLDRRDRDTARDMLTAGIQSRNGLAGMQSAGVDIAALCAEAGVPYSEELVQQPQEADLHAHHDPDIISLGAMDGRSKELANYAKKQLRRVVTIIGGPQGERGGLLVGLETAYRQSAADGKPVRWDPDTSVLERLADDLRKEARKQAVQFFSDSGLTGYEAALSRADSWCQDHARLRTARLIQTMRDRATDHARAAYAQPAVKAAAEKYWTERALPLYQGDVMSYWTQLSASLLGHYRSAPVYYATSQ